MHTIDLNCDMGEGLNTDAARDEAALAALEAEHMRTAAALKALRNG